MQSDYFAFVAAAYGASALVIGALIVHAAWDARRQARTLAALEARGFRRRSAAATPADAAGGEAGR